MKLVFPSQTNQRLAEIWLEQRGVGYVPEVDWLEVADMDMTAEVAEEMTHLGGAEPAINCRRPRK